MKELPTPTRAGERVKALAEYNLLDAPHEEIFNAFTRVAAMTCGTPAAVITLAGRDMLTFKAHYGVGDVGATSLAGSFSSHIIAGRELIEVRDARLDPRFAAHRHVNGKPNIVFYAGAPLITPGGVAIGAVCVLDRERHTLTKEQRAGLLAIADAVIEQFEMRRSESGTILSIAPATDDPVGILHAELTLQNERLTALSAIARSIFAALEPPALVEALVGGVRELIGAEARLLVARPEGGFALTGDLLVPEDNTANGGAFVDTVSGSDGPLLDKGGRRAAIRIPGSLGHTRYILDVVSERRLLQADLFSVGLLGQYFAVAARNVELYGELQARRAAVVELNQVKNDLITMLAHDFKGPLTTIVGFADVLAEDERFDDESRKFLTTISTSAMRLASLATDTLALSQLEQNELRLELEKFDLVELVREVVGAFSVTRAIDLQTDRPELRIAGDPGRLRQVFENLIGNAIKYTLDDEPIEVFLRARGSGVEFSVRDRGIGVPESDKAKLFGRFARGGNARALGISGTGFGLYLTKTIVEMHGGTLSVDSIEGEGSTFRAFLPAAVVERRRHRGRFVLVDADGDAKSYVAHALRHDGFAATVVADGAEMLETIGELQFDAAVVDVDCVGMPLDEFVGLVAGRTALIRVDASTVEATPGWDGYIVKPFLAKDLQATIDAAIAARPKTEGEPPVTA